MSPTDETAPGRDRSARIRRLVWTAWTVTLLIGAATYAWKAADSRSAFVRWRHQVLQISQGVDIWDRYYFPNPPIVPILLYPLMILPPVVGAMIWYGMKVGMAAWCVRTVERMAQGATGRRLPGWGLALLLILSLRPVLSDLQHGNINLLILFFVVGTLELWRRRRDTLSGLTLALAIATKVTPALFLPYFLYKRSWKAAGACVLGLALFLLVVPSIAIGPQANWRGLTSWHKHTISPFVAGARMNSIQEVNQSMIGVLTRLFTESRAADRHGNNGTEHDLNLASWDHATVTAGVKALAVAVVLLGAWLCRTRTRDRTDPRLLGEFALVVLTMLFVSERSWKHHYVTLLLPQAYLVYRVAHPAIAAATRRGLFAVLAISAGLMALTSDGVGGLLAGGQGHEMALFFGLFFWSGAVLYLATARRLVLERDQNPFDAPGGASGSVVPAPHVGVGQPTRLSA